MDTPAEFSRRFLQGRMIGLGLRAAPSHAPRARRVEMAWRWPLLPLLAATVPAFYAELLSTEPPWLAMLSYGLAGTAVALALVHTALATRQPAQHLAANVLDILLAVGLLASAWMPPSKDSSLLLSFRMLVALLTLVRMVWSVKQLLSRGGLMYLLLTAGMVLGFCGVGFWWLEPKARTLGDGLWLAFTTAATVGYGDIVPTTAASKIFSFFVVMLGYGVLSLVTAAIATQWVETEERTIEREILRDMHRQMDALRAEIVQLRDAVQATAAPACARPEPTSPATLPATSPAAPPGSSSGMPPPMPD